MQIVDKKITAEVAETMIADYLNDMNALFKLAEEETLELIEKSDGMTEAELLKAIDNLIG